jgi:peptidase E
MNLLLLSGVFKTEVIRDAFFNHLPKPSKDTKIIFIGTDTISAFYVNIIEQIKQMLNERGILNENITVFNLYDEIPPKIKEYNVVLMLGGNAFQYMYRIRKLGLFDQLNQFIEDEGFYVGGSAGAIIAGPCVDVESFSNFVNDVGLEDLSGFGWVDFITIPHLSSRENPEKPYEYHRRTGAKMIYITDYQAILVHDDFYKII